MTATDTDRIDSYVWRISMVVLVGSIMSILDTTIVNVALATLSRELKASIAEIQWVVTGYMLALAAVIPISGWAARRFGAKRIYLLSLILFTAGSALCGLATSTTELIVFRVLQGLGGGMIMPIGQMMMADVAGPKRMGRVMSIMAVPVMLAPILGPTIGGLILQNVSWRWIFYVNVPIGILGTIAALRVLPSGERGGAGSLDFRGLALMATGLPLFTYGLAEIGITGSFTAVKVVVPILVGLALVGVFVLHALRVKNPLLDLRLYRRPTFSSASLAMFCLAAALFGGMILLPLYWQDVRHESVVVTGLLTGPQGIGAALAMPIAGKLTDRVGGGPACVVRRGRDRARDDPVRDDRRPHFDPVAVRRHGRARHRHRLRLHAGDGGRVRRARALRALARDPAAQRAPAGGRLDRHRRAGRRAPARARRRAQHGRRRRRLRDRVLVVGRPGRRGGGSRDHPDARRARSARGPWRRPPTRAPRRKRSRRRWRHEHLAGSRPDGPSRPSRLGPLGIRPRRIGPAASRPAGCRAAGAAPRRRSSAGWRRRRARPAQRRRSAWPSVQGRDCRASADARARAAPARGAQ